MNKIPAHTPLTAMLCSVFCPVFSVCYCIPIPQAYFGLQYNLSEEIISEYMIRVYILHCECPLRIISLLLPHSVDAILT
jgi:hypothetical protein